MKFWPDAIQGSISLSFDDGLRSHIEFAVPELNQHKLRATFYLNPKGDAPDPLMEQGWREKLTPWKPVQAAGHEMGNHTLSHPCSLNIHADWLEGKNLQEWSLQRIEQDIIDAQTRLESIFPGQKNTSFAYPCYESTIGHGLTRQSYTPVIAKRFIAARAKGELRGDLANDPLYCDLHHLSSWPVERQPGAFMIGLVEQTIAAGGWGIFTIHGIHEGHLPIGDTDFIELLDHLVRRQDVVWIAPVAEIAQYVRNKRPK